MTQGFFSYLGLVDDAERANRLVASFFERHLGSLIEALTLNPMQLGQGGGY